MTAVRTVNARLALAVGRLDAGFHASPGEAAAARLVGSGLELRRLEEFATVSTPSRFARVWAAPGEPSAPYLRPYDVFDYLPVPSDHLSLVRTTNLDALRLKRDDLLVTCSGRNLGPTTVVDEHLSQFALSHDMVRVTAGEPSTRAWLLAYLRSETGQALLRRGRAGSVVDHITVADVERLPVPQLADHVIEAVAGLVKDAVALRGSARLGLEKALSRVNEAVGVASPEAVRSSWTLRARELSDRVDAARYHPVVRRSQEAVAKNADAPLGDLAKAVLPVRYRRFYVGPEHGRPIMSGRQLLQTEPVNLRFVADRSFRNPKEYELAEGATIFGAVGRSDGRIGQPAFIAEDRAAWLASNDVMRLFPQDGVRPGAVWLGCAIAATQAQIKSLSFGSVVDHMNPWDVEALRVPSVSDELASAVEFCWRDFATATTHLREASALVEQALKPT